MSVIEVVLVYVGIPAGVILCIVSAVVLPGLSRRKRYRPGEAWEYEPVWYIPHPAALDAELQHLLRGAGGSDRPAIAAASRPALTAGSGSTDSVGSTDSAAGDAAQAGTEPTVRGGAHGEW